MLGESMQWIRTPGWKYVWLSGSGHEQLFDMAGDRAERIDRARDPECAHVLQECRRALCDELTGRQEGYVRDGVLVPGREPLNVLDGAGARPSGGPLHPSRHIGAAYCRRRGRRACALTLTVPSSGCRAETGVWGGALVC